MRAKIAFLFQIMIISFFLAGCGNDEPEIVPDVYVNFDFNLQEPQFTNLNVILGATIKDNVGYNGNGVIVFRADQNEYKAFDATCPQHISTKTPVVLNANGTGKATCPECSTVYFLMSNGYPPNGYKLKQYRTIVNGSYIRVTN